MIPVIPELKMNNTERRYSVQLELLKSSGQMIDWKFEPLNFRLADRTFYKPDFLLVFKDRFEIHEVKGYWTDDALVKFKVAAQMYPWFVWKAVHFKNGRWEYRG